MSKRPVLILAGALTVVTMAGAAVLEVSHEPGAPFATIQAAIDAAVPGTDEVYVRCGRYLENVVMRNGVPVRGEKPACTTIDGRSLGPVVRMTDLAATKLSGFTIENGLDDKGGGIRVLRGSPIIDGNRIRNNRVNDATTAYDCAGGVGVEDTLPAPAPVITRNLIVGNEGVTTGGAFVPGGGRVEGNVFADNGGNWAALYAYGFSGTILNNTIVRNRRGAGLSMGFSDGATVASNVVAYNPIGVTASQLPAFSANDVFGNAQNYVDLADQTGVSGNISTDPQFVSEESDNSLGYEPKSASPLTELAAPGASMELSRLSSPVDGRSTGHPLRDIGAKENEGVTRLRPTIRDAWTWDPGLHSPMDWNFFRGDLAVLRATGVYIQDPAIVTGAYHFCDVTLSFGDSASPPAGSAWFQVYGPLGFDSDRNPRPYAPLHCQLP
jgi:hypothetical protein